VERFWKAEEGWILLRTDDGLLPYNRLNESALVIEDDSEAEETTDAMVAAGVPVIDAPELNRMRVVARFEPPSAQADYARWRQQHAGSLATIPDDGVEIDTGRAEGGGTFVRVRVKARYTHRFT
jgi:hypothetical protein